MSEYTELQADYCPACGTKLREAWMVPLAASPKLEFVAETVNGHVEATDAGLRYYQHAEEDDP
jgi:hypothetical protein